MEETRATRKQKRELANVQKSEGQVQVPFIQVGDRKRQNNNLDPSQPRGLGKVKSFFGRSTSQHRKIAERPQPSSSASWSPSSTWWSSSSWDQRDQTWHSHGWHDNKWSDQWIRKDKVEFTLRMAAGNSLA